MSYGNVPPPPPAAPGSAQSYASPPAPVQQRSSKKLIWIIVAVILAVVVLIVLFIGAIIAAAFAAMKSNEPYQHAVEVATHDPRALAELGPPVKPGWWLSGNINVSGSSGDADFAIPVAGTLHQGTMYVVAKKSAGRWTYQTLELRIEGEPGLDLLPPLDAIPKEK